MKMQANIIGFVNEWEADDLPAKTDLNVAVDGKVGLYVVRWYRCRRVTVHPYPDDPSSAGTGNYRLADGEGGRSLYRWTQPDMNAWTTFEINDDPLYLAIGSAVLGLGGTNWYEVWMSNGQAPYPDTWYT